MPVDVPSRLARGVGVDECGGQLGHRMGQGVFSVVCDPVSILQTGLGGDVEFRVGV